MEVEQDGSGEGLARTLPQCFQTTLGWDLRGRDPGV